VSPDSTESDAVDLSEVPLWTTLCRRIGVASVVVGGVLFYLFGEARLGPGVDTVAGWLGLQFPLSVSPLLVVALLIGGGVALFLLPILTALLGAIRL
jgi:hypothetical protein